MGRSAERSQVRLPHEARVARTSTPRSTRASCRQVRRWPRYHGQPSGGAQMRPPRPTRGRRASLRPSRDRALLGPTRVRTTAPEMIRTATTAAFEIHATPSWLMASTSQSNGGIVRLQAQSVAVDQGTYCDAQEESVWRMALTLCCILSVSQAGFRTRSARSLIRCRSSSQSPISAVCTHFGSVGAIFFTMMLATSCGPRR
jgi:hypothetical protein